MGQSLQPRLAGGRGGPGQHLAPQPDPLWIAAGAIGLLALLAIVLLAMRGRSRDRVTDVRETTTVIKKD